jgi:hypothetical protein
VLCLFILKIFYGGFMAHIATAEFIGLFKDYPIKSQDDKKDPLVIAKVFDTFGSATWFLTEFDANDNIAFGYVTGLGSNEFGYVSITELEEIKHDQLGVLRIERDLYFSQQPLSQLVDI